MVSALSMIALFIAAVVRPGSRARSSAASAATCGLAIEVPSE